MICPNMNKNKHAITYKAKYAKTMQKMHKTCKNIQSMSPLHLMAYIYAKLSKNMKDMSE